jgi:hypothetical protein
MKNTLDNFYRENQNTHFMLINFFSENRAVYGAMWKKYGGARRKHNTVHVLSMLDNLGCTRKKNTHTHTHGNMYFLLLFHSGTGFVNALQCYVMRTLRVLFVTSLR